MSIQSKRLKLEQPKFFTRCLSINDKHKYGIARTTLVKKWKIKTPNVRAKLTINGLPIELDYLDGKEFDITKIRTSLRDIIPLSKEENDLCIIESTIFGSQIQAMEHYKYFPIEKLNEYIFTGDLCIIFNPYDGENFPEEFEIEETHIISEVQLKQRLKNETLREIDDNNCEEKILSKINIKKQE